MGLIEELKSIRDGAGCYEAPVGVLQIEGADAPNYLNRMVTNEVINLPLGEGRYQAILDRKGMVRSLFYLLKTGPEAFYAIVPPQLIQKTEEILVKGKFIEKVTVKNVSGEWEFVKVVGTSAVTDLTPALSLIKERVAQGRVRSWQDPLFKIPVWNLLAPVGAIHELPLQNLPQISKAVFDILRIESGIPEYGIDIDETHILLEANLPQFYKRQKGCYPGQEVIERILAYGKGRTPRRLVVLESEGEKKIGPKAEVHLQQEVTIGHVTSFAYDPLTNKTVMLAYLEAKFLGNELSQRPFQVGDDILRIFQAD